ncbi:MAG: hypothetical protein DRH26_08140, partial [Deltaproteobacteria bacterium]
MVNIIKISIVIIAVLGFFTGCEKQAETKKPARAPVIVSGKILPLLPGKTGEKPILQPKSVGPTKTDQAQTLPKPNVKKPDTQKTVQVPSGDVTKEPLKNEQKIEGTQPGKPEATEGV